MATDKQILANRNNALKSTGPKTIKGKYWSSRNHITHGLTTKDLVVGEDQKAFEIFRDEMLKCLKPIGILEEQIVFKIIDIGFRLRRVFAIESGIYNFQILSYQASKDKIDIADQLENKENQKDVIVSPNKSKVLMGFAFGWDSDNGSSFLKLNTIEDRLLKNYQKLLVTLNKMRGGKDGLGRL